MEAKDLDISKYNAVQPPTPRRRSKTWNLGAYFSVNWKSEREVIYAERWSIKDILRQYFENVVYYFIYFITNSIFFASPGLLRGAQEACKAREAFLFPEGIWKLVILSDPEITDRVSQK